MALALSPPPCLPDSRNILYGIELVYSYYYVYICIFFKYYISGWSNRKVTVCVTGRVQAHIREGPRVSGPSQKFVRPRICT